MPRGNDAEEAAAELESREGTAPNAEDLLRAHADAQDPELLSASMQSINEEATADLDLSDADVPKGHEAVAGAVRGNHVIYTVRDEQGAAYKTVEEFDAGKGKSKGRGRKAKSDDDEGDESKASSESKAKSKG